VRRVPVRSELVWRQLAETRMWAFGVVVEAPRFNHRRASASEENTCSFRHSSRSLPLKLSIKPFCCGLPGRNIVPLHAVVLGPLDDRLAGQFGAVV